MKNYISIIALACIVGLFSCNDFLDVTSGEKVLQKDLFKDSEGTRMAVNGVYKNLSSPKLYGENLSWGFVSALGHNYEVSKKTLPRPLYYAANFQWDLSQVALICEEVWLQGYNIIANCNNIIQEVEQRDSVFFKEKSLEKNLILGEMYGIRAMMHFDLLRLFAPAPKANYQGLSIPYVKEYPNHRPEHLATQKVLENVIKDMERAKEILAPIDTIKFKSNISHPTGRFRHFNYSEVEEGEFFNYRCERMNFFGATALLARIYMYKGDYQKAYENAMLIYDFHKRHWFKWTDPIYQGQINNVDWIHIKRPDELLLMFANNKNFGNIESYTSNSYYGIHRFRMKKIENLFQEDLDDFRYTGWYNQYGLKRYLTWLRPTGTSSIAKEVADEQGPLIPIIRFSEMYHILIEYYLQAGKISEAVQLFNDLRIARGVKNKIPENIDSSELRKKLINEMIRETLTEGQTFFMYKRLNQDIFNGETDMVMEPEYWTAPMPHSESAY